MISITRFALKHDCTIGRLSIDEEPIYYTIERPWLDNTPYISCIPEGRYPLLRHNSPSFGADTWMVGEVPNRTFILFHVANVSNNVQGCIGLGMGVYENLTGVKNSRAAIDEFYRFTQGRSKETLVIESGFIGQ